MDGSALVRILEVRTSVHLMAKRSDITEVQSTRQMIGVTIGLGGGKTAHPQRRFLFGQQSIIETYDLIVRERKAETMDKKK